MKFVMKKILVLVLLLFASVALAAEKMEVALNPAVMGGVANNACTGSEVLGTAVDGGSNSNLAANYIYCHLYTAPCTGTITTTGKGGLYSYDNVPTDARVCVYSNPAAGTNPGTDGANNLKLTCTTNKLGDELNQWVTGVMDASSPVVITKGTTYWVCVSAGDAAWAAHYDTAASRYFLACSDCETTMPANLAGEWTTVTEKRTSVYVEIK